MARIIKFAKAGGPEVLEFIETEVPAPAASDVRIRVKAIGINRAESMWRNDAYIEPVKFPAGLGYEAAGIVDAAGQSSWREQGILRRPSEEQLRPAVDLASLPSQAPAVSGGLKDMHLGGYARRAQGAEHC